MSRSLSASIKKRTSWHSLRNSQAISPMSPEMETNRNLRLSIEACSGSETADSYVTENPVERRYKKLKFEGSKRSWQATRSGVSGSDSEGDLTGGATFASACALVQVILG